MTLQLALDGAENGRTLAEAMALARAAREYTDVIEVVTGMMGVRQAPALCCATGLRRWSSSRAPALACPFLLM